MVEQTVQNALMAAADELFAGTTNEVKVKGRDEVVAIKPATVKRMREISAFIQSFVTSIDESTFLTIVTTVSDQQKAAIQAGEDPYKIDTMALVKKSISNLGGMLEVLTMALDRIGPLAAIFTDLNAEEFDELELDDATAVVLAVFGRNYHFFTQTVLLQIRAYIAALAIRQKEANQSTESASANQKPNQRK